MQNRKVFLVGFLLFNFCFVLSLDTGNLLVLGDLNASSGSVGWSVLSTYPAACSAGQYVSGVGDTLTCGTPAGGSGGGDTNWATLATIIPWDDTNVSNFLTLQDINSTDGNVAININADGNVGIGAAATTKKVFINGELKISKWFEGTVPSSANLIDLNANGGGARIDYRDSAYTTFWRTQNYWNDFYFTMYPNFNSMILRGNGGADFNGNINGDFNLLKNAPVSKQENVYQLQNLKSRGKLRILADYNSETYDKRGQYRIVIFADSWGAGTTAGIKEYLSPFGIAASGYYNFATTALNKLQNQEHDYSYSTGHWTERFPVTGIAGLNAAKIDSNTAEAWVQDICTGTDANVYFEAHANGGDVNYYVDNVYVGNLDTTADTNHLKTLSVSLGQYGKHTVKVVTLDTNHTSLLAINCASNRNGVIINGITNSGSTAARFVNVDSNAASIQLTPLEPDLLIVQLGINDISLGAVSYNNNMDSLISRVRTLKPYSDVVISSQGSFAGDANALLRGYMPDMERIAKRWSGVFVDNYTTLPEWNIGLTNGIYYDSYHLTNTGYKVIADNIVNKVLGLNTTPYPKASWAANAQGIYIMDKNVGIGITIPTRNLQVVGSTGVKISASQASPSTYANALDINTNGFTRIDLKDTSGPNSDLNFWRIQLFNDKLIWTRYPIVNAFTMQSDGNIGVNTGTNTITRKFEVTGEAKISDKLILASGAKLCSNTDANCFYPNAGGGGTSSQWTTSGTNIYYNDGNVGIGTITPEAKLHVSNVQAPNTYTIKVDGNNLGTPTNPLNFLCSVDGNCGINLSGKPAYPLDVNTYLYVRGSASINGTMNANSASIGQIVVSSSNNAVLSLPGFSSATGIQYKIMNYLSAGTAAGTIGAPIVNSPALSWTEATSGGSPMIAGAFLDRFTINNSAGDLNYATNLYVGGPLRYNGAVNPKLGEYVAWFDKNSQVSYNTVRSDSNIMVVDADVNVNNKTFINHDGNLTLTSGNGNTFNCGVTNEGTFTCVCIECT